MTPAQAIQLAPDFRDKVWGGTLLEPWFPNPAAGRKTGEVWFSTLELPILVKFLFTTENLSVQVHPSGECGVGKTEMWHILRADAGARIALGFREEVTAARAKEAVAADRVRSARAGGSIAELRDAKGALEVARAGSRSAVERIQREQKRGADLLYPRPASLADVAGRLDFVPVLKQAHWNART